MNHFKGICILGSTGTIGINTLDVISRHSNDFKIIALTANTNVEKLKEQCLLHNPIFAVMVDENKAEILQQALSKTSSETKVISGKKSLEFVALRSW